MAVIEVNNTLPGTRDRLPAGSAAGDVSGVFTKAGAPVNGTSGTFAGQAGPGTLLVDVTNKLLYQNTNTLASPTWTLQRRITQQAAIVHLTDSSGGAANDTIAAITNAANAGSADLGPTRDAIADLAAKLDALLTALETAGVLAAP